ncbi:microfilament motor [Amanita muscaria]
MDEHALLIALSFFTALFKVDWESASLIFQSDGTLQNLMEVVDIIPTASLNLEVAHLFAQACSHKACRAIFTSEVTEWLQVKSRQTADAKVRAAAAIALIKLSKGSQADAVEVTGESAQISAKINEDDLAALMKGLIINDEEKSSVQDAIEGLAYLSVDPHVKELLSKDKIFLKKVISLLPNKKKISSDPPNNSLVYGILLLVSNICTYRPRLTEEQQHIQRLKQMTNPSNKKSSTDSTNSKSKLDEDHHVKERVRRMVDAGVLAVFPATLSYLDSPSIRTCAAKALLSIVEDKDHRGKVLQAGGAKSLILVIQRDLASVKGSKQPTKDNAPLEAIQALAKLAITSSPIQVFGANEGEMYDVIRPFSILVQHDLSTLLQRFEGMMALTNLATQSPELASRIAKTEGLMNKVELLLLEDHTLVRRAAMELVCNLIVGSDDIFDKYGGGENIPGAKAKLHVVLALSDVDDIPTRAAASGALATLTVSPNACRALYELQHEHHRAFHILALLIDPSSVPEDKREEGDELSTELDLVHRGVVCVRNLFGNLDDDTTLRFLVKEAQEAGLVIALSRVVKGEVGKVTEAILQPAIEVLKRIANMAPSKKAGKKVTASAKKPSKVVKADWKEGFKKKQVGVTDMTLLTTISNESINENLQKRWTNAEIYTYIGNVLISVNPFRDLGIYTDEGLQKYRGKNRLEVPPHVFSIAESAYYNMNAYHENQCVIISGESGAGKTEAAKRIMQYIAAVSGGQDSSIQEIKDMVLATNPLLESFGCAKTLRNNNSSRHGKYLEIMFNSNGEPVGARITNYLLEKGRVVGQIENERNFHIFYQFTKGASDDYRETFGLQGPESYAYTSMSNCLEVQDVDDVKEFHDTIKAMQVIGLTEHEQTEIFRMLATILWLGNVQFEEMDDGNSRVADTNVTDFVAYLMDSDAALVQKVMTTRVVETQRGGRRGSVYDVPLNPTQATAGRDALAKAIYNNLFEWIVSRVNVSMKTRSAFAHVIGILDIFGFEIFEDNSFEQLCINYVNEKLQQIFIELTLKAEQEEYVREQIKWTPINYFNNKVVCDLIEERRPPGIFAALNDACATAHADSSAADNSFVQRTAMLSSNAHFEARGAQFLVRHYAGDVLYNIAGMTDKNKDSLIKDLLDLIASSGNAFLQTIFPDRPDPNSKKRPPTAGDRIKQSAGALVDNLMKAQPSYIRTIKPNQNRSSTEYDTKAILHQIKYLGLQENIRVRRAGFAYRNTFEKIVERFYLLSPNTSYAGEYTWNGDAKSGCQQMLKDTGIAKEEWQMGVTKAFIKNPETLFALETMRDRYWHNMAARIQRAYRNYMRYKNECAKRIQRFWKNNKEAIVYSQTRDYGHQILAGRKERRRFSLIGYRRFMGDYLDINGESPLGEELASACSIGPSEPVSFSAKAQLLVSKLGRSSKPSPRYLILTQKAVYIVIATAKDGSVQMSLERKLPLVTIKSISMSNLRDDWMVFHTNVSEEGDPVISCYFKTEFATHLLKLTQASIGITIQQVIEYNKKKEKKAQIKFIKDESVTRGDVYKSHTIHVSSGESPDSLSRPPAKRKPGIVRPITHGKLLRAGGPDKPKGASKPKPVSRPLPGQSTVPAAVAAIPKPTSKPTPSTSSSAGIRPPPPPRAVPTPPPAPPTPKVPLYKAKYAFEGQEGELSLKKDDILELVKNEDNGWLLMKKGGVEGWAPENYLELLPPSAEPAAPPPPPRPKPGAPLKTTNAAPVAAKPTAKPVAVFPGAAGNGTSAPPWKKTNSNTTTAPAPAVGSKPKPPPIAAKPGVGGAKAPPKPAIPAAPRPNAGAASSKLGGLSKPATPVGQLDLAAALAKRAQRMAEE